MGRDTVGGAVLLFSASGGLEFGFHLDFHVYTYIFNHIQDYEFRIAPDLPEGKHCRSRGMSV